VFDLSKLDLLVIQIALSAVLAAAAVVAAATPAPTLGRLAVPAASAPAAA
jgi:hypothetical protein